jgi:hypothetical protein
LLLSRHTLYSIWRFIVARLILTGWYHLAPLSPSFGGQMKDLVPVVPGFFS